MLEYIKDQPSTKSQRRLSNQMSESSSDDDYAQSNVPSVLRVSFSQVDTESDMNCRIFNGFMINRSSVSLKTTNRLSIVEPRETGSTTNRFSIVEPRETGSTNSNA